MKYVLMFTSTPDLDAAVDPARAKEVYGRIYQWFRDNAGPGRPWKTGQIIVPAGVAGPGHHRHHRPARRAARRGRRRRALLGGQGGRRRLHRHRRAGPRRGPGDGPHLAAAEAAGMTLYLTGTRHFYH